MIVYQKQKTITINMPFVDCNMVPFKREGYKTMNRKVLSDVKNRQI